MSKWSLAKHVAGIVAAIAVWYAIYWLLYAAGF